jgi:acyl-CoA reductase-like NAD-dependent aldehyde dehydrogenase
VITGVARSHTVFQEEVFGPVLSVTAIDSVEEAIGAANDSRYGLTAAVWSDNIKSANTVARELRSGTVWVNTFDRADFGVPFGGFGQSGHGRAKSIHAMGKYSDLKSVWLEY